MSTPRRLGVALCLLAFLAVCVLALVLRTSGPFAGLPGIEGELADAAREIVEVDAPGASVTADGRSVNVRLPEVVNPTFDAAALRAALADIDGVRSVELVGNPTIAADPQTDPEPTATAEPEPAEPTATAEPEPAEPTATAEPEPAEPTATAEPEPEPTATPEPPTPAEIVAGLDLDDVEFEPGTARLTAQDTAVLDVVADRLQGIEQGTIEVQAHTDNVGDPDVNLLLSQLRAEAVVAYLTDRGVDAGLLTARGYGAELPIADNATEQGRASNQRVELVVEGN